MAARKIVTAVGSAVGQGVLTGLWTAAGELSPAKRRVLRFASGAGVAAFGFLTAKGDERRDEKGD
ncbi:hypothetical protein AB0M20_05150, partial [Actinoplanes sp. NPDC051633]|uniref:hypothetical protein n=1 Tax=Actinoplanes sp. NPDC051633 TaxID=3155670 RepID=UPI00341E3645